MIFSGDALLIPDENAIDEVNKNIEGIDLIVVIQDICKYVAFFSGKPYMIVATAPSIDGVAKFI